MQFGQPFVDALLPGVGFEARLLLRLDVLVFEGPVRPPLFAVVVRLHGFRKELIAVARQRLDIDNSRLDRPEAPSSGLIAQIGISFRSLDDRSRVAQGGYRSPCPVQNRNATDA